MRSLRLMAFALGVALILTETWRGIGAARPFLFWLDEIIVGALLIASAALLNPDTTRRRAFFAAVFGLSVGMLYESLSRNLSTPETVNAGNFTLGQLTVFTGIALAVSIYGFVNAILHPRVQ